MILILKSTQPGTAWAHRHLKRNDCKPNAIVMATGDRRAGEKMTIEITTTMGPLLMSRFYNQVDFDSCVLVGEHPDGHLQIAVHAVSE